MIVRTAAVRLTALFSVVLLLLVGCFAVGVYLYVTTVFDYDAAGVTDGGTVGAVERSFADLRNGLIAGFVSLMIVVPILCYAMIRLVLRPVQRGYREQQHFVENASHEFRTPLAVIQGELELAFSRPRGEDEYRAAATAALGQVGRLTRLTDDLLQLAGGRSHALAASFEPVEVARLVDRCRLEAQRRPAVAEKARLRVSAEPGIRVRGSTELLARAVSNLIENAVKFGPSGEEVLIEASRRRRRVRISVTNRGRSLATGERRRVFDRFWRSVDAVDLPGHGLGLTIVRQVARAHRGSVAITSTTRGTTVTLELPVGRIG